VIRLRRPSREEIGARLGLSDRPFSYAEVGASADLASVRALSGYDLDLRPFSLGRGRDLYERARSSLLAWRHFEIPWLELLGGDEPASTGQVVATLTRVLGLWFLNPCRVVYTECPPDPSNEVAFAYGTLAGHVERGEERFTVRFNPLTEDVTYEILAFSYPAVPLTRLAYPWVRRLQRRFATSSAEALSRACRPTGGRPPGGMLYDLQGRPHD
jgi:uncharacterized protein (UPF0548 family)